MLLKLTSFLRTKLVVERRAEQVNRTKFGRQAMKERELLKRYGSQEKVDKLKTLLKQKGMFEYDDDFPDDEEDPDRF